MTTVKVKGGESVESALRRFKKDCEREGIVTEMKKREYYEKPSTLRRRKIDAIKRKLQKRKREGSMRY